jgi:hypothetical protein
MRAKFREVWLCTILVEGDYGHLKWNNMLSALKYRIEVIPLDVFENQFAYLFDVQNGNLVQDIPIMTTNAKGVLNIIYISRNLQEAIVNSYPAFKPLLKKGYVVILKTFKKFSPALTEIPERLEVEKCLLNTQQFCKNFRICTALTIGDYFKPSIFFAYIADHNMAIRGDYPNRLDDRLQMYPSHPTYLLLKFPL